MHLTPRELDKLQLHAAGFVAQKRYARGLTLNYPETVALISAQILEFIRDGDSVAELMEKGKKLLGLHEVMPGISEMVHEVQVEGTFPDGTKLVTVHSPICNEWGEENLALYASGLTRTKKPNEAYQEFKAGEFVVEDQELELNAGREKISLLVFHTGDRPVQVGSHYNFFEVNPALDFDRKAAFGFRLDIPSGTAVRFEPGERKEVSLVKIAGNQRVYGGNGFISGELSEENLANALEKARAAGFKMGASK